MGGLDAHSFFWKPIFIGNNSVASTAETGLKVLGEAMFTYN